MGDKQGEEIVGDKNIIVETVEVQVCGGCYDAVGIAGRKLPGAKWISCPHIGGGGFLGVAVWAYGVWRVAS
jgi:hypothetical protein